MNVNLKKRRLIFWSADELISGSLNLKGDINMHKIVFYRDRKGYEPVLDFIRKLSEKKDKDSRINFNKIRDYVKALSVYGTEVGEPYVKHLDDDIWELRPIRNRILFAAWYQGGFILLHSFLKTTQKTPQREIEKAKRELADIKERGIKL